MKFAAPFLLIGLLGACAADPELHTHVGINRDGIKVYPAATARVGIMTLSVTP
ncbi:hypothetical protein AXZ77_3320 [Thioclava sp. ES.031]|uniref:Uncharacterized protein n=1 Tax=Thioclava electrotropha TaxID=1549850 RepID=A0ABX6YY36_9RHOB|nr:MULTISPECIES: hypothetical protein [Thioclava]PFG64677.1 hypothetical protein AXZ77_3320 [Thioclava sp. ES.031]QPZ92417.1 hypothetical protein AKL02_016970 [Thioclava electrotropha]